ncbi:hypothetical protein Q9S36_08075 [Microbacterium sp. ARD31]|nr:hypothetical protein [Microbacterium sp. ARD31]MDT0180166.1 hypothetical protein [Microbacterium sp. ARD31]
MVSLVVAGSIVFTLAGYAREPGSRPGAIAVVVNAEVAISYPVVNR